MIFILREKKRAIKQELQYFKQLEASLSLANKALIHISVSLSTADTYIVRICIYDIRNKI